MGFLKKLIGIGLTVGATVAVMKVAERYQQNQIAGPIETGESGQTGLNETVSGVAAAAKEVYDETAAAVKEKAPAVMEKVKVTVADAAEAVKEKAPEAVERVRRAARPRRKKAKEPEASVGSEAPESAGEAETRPAE